MSSSPRRSDSPQGKRSASPGAKKVKIEKTELRREQRNEQIVQNFIQGQRQRDLKDAQKAFDKLTPAQAAKYEQFIQLANSIAGALEFLDQIRDKSVFNREDVGRANSLLYDTRIEWNADVAQRLDEIATSGQGNQAKVQARDLIGQVQRFLLENRDPDRDQKLALLNLLQQAWTAVQNLPADDVKQEIQELVDQLEEEPEGPVLDFRTQPWWKEYEQLMDQLSNLPSLVPAEKANFITKADAIQTQVEEYAAQQGIQGFEEEQLRLLLQELFDVIDSKPLQTFRAPQPRVPFPLLREDQLKTADQVKKLLSTYSASFESAKELEKANIIQNLRVISDWVSRQDDFFLTKALTTVLKKTGQVFADRQDFALLQSVIKQLQWPERENWDNAEYLQQVQDNFGVIIEKVPFFRQAFERMKTNGESPAQSSCIPIKQLDLHQLFAIAWFYCSGSTGVFDFFSTGGGKTATAWATLRMYRDQTRGRYGKQDNAKLIWVTAEHLIEDAWKDSWAYSDVMIGYEPGKATPAQIAERAEIEKEVWFISYRLFSNFIVGRKSGTSYNTYLLELKDRYGIELPKDSKLLPQHLAGAKIIVDEAQKLVEPMANVKSSEILEFFYNGYAELEMQDLELWKLCVLSATPSVTMIEAVPKLLNLLITYPEARLPITEEGIGQYFSQGEWEPGAKAHWEMLTRGLVVCYDGHADKSLFAVKNINPMIVVRGNELQVQELRNCKGSNADKCKRAVIDYAKVVKPSLKLPEEISPISGKFSRIKADQDLLEPQAQLKPQAQPRPQAQLKSRPKAKPMLKAKPKWKK